MMHALSLRSCQVKCCTRSVLRVTFQQFIPCLAESRPMAFASAPERSPEVPMSELKLETVKLQSVIVASDNVTRLPSLASIEAGIGASAVVSSSKRRLSSKAAKPEADAGPRYNAMFGGTAVPRAGRLAGLSGVPSRHLSWQRWLQPTLQTTQNCSTRFGSSGSTMRMPGDLNQVGREMRTIGTR